MNDQKLHAGSRQTLTDEISSLIVERGRILRMKLDANLLFKTRMAATDLERDMSEITWILRAQIGTIEKIETLFTPEFKGQTFELLAIARNLFENLVWLKLFNQASQYGFLFYEHLLDQQKQEAKNLISKIESEILLFEKYSKIEDEDFKRILDDIDPENSNDEEIRAAGERHHDLCERLDAEARRSFSLYAAAAKFNGYHYQCHLLRTDVIPKIREKLRLLEERANSYNSAKQSIIAPEMQKDFRVKWNWRARAEQVGMVDQYDYLYRYTSRLLHSTAVNIITEKLLSESEILILLEYVFVTIGDIYNVIETFKFPGQVNAVLIRT